MAAAEAAAPVVLDVSRLVSRIGLGPLTGIDRVEAAWLRHLQGRPHRLLARVPRRQVLLPASAGAMLLDWLDDPAAVSAARGLVVRLRRARSPRARAEEALARRAEGVGTRSGALLRLPPGAVWMALGHANLDPLPARAMRGVRRVVMIHDTIPLDHPQFTRAGQTEAFGRRLTAALQAADLILTVSEATRADVLRWQPRLTRGPAPRVVAVPIGTVLTPPDPGAIPPGLPLDRPFLVALGTIEPRKNHAVLLDAWALLERRLPPAQVPRLFILGRRGWLNADVFARLDAAPAGGPVIERAGLSDAAIAALLERAHGLVMPSLAEGFGLPLTEAAGRGVPILAAPGPAAREVLAGRARWLDPHDPAAWAEAAATLAAHPAPPRDPPLAVPTWADHFRAVEALLAALPQR